jgi:hypothetical protein
MNEIILSLILWATQNSGLAYSGQALPEIKQVSNVELAEVIFEGNVPAGYQEYQLAALYQNNLNRIYVSNVIDIDSDYGKSVLLHELVHFLQYKVGYHENNDCLRSLEVDAYRLQNKYLVSNGHQPTISAMDIFFRSVCPS